MCYFYIILPCINFTLRYIGCKTHIHRSHILCVLIKCWCRVMWRRKIKISERQQKSRKEKEKKKVNDKTWTWNWAQADKNATEKYVKYRETPKPKSFNDQGYFGDFVSIWFPKSPKTLHWKPRNWTISISYWNLRKKLNDFILFDLSEFKAVLRYFAMAAPFFSTPFQPYVYQVFTPSHSVSSRFDACFFFFFGLFSIRLPRKLRDTNFFLNLISFILNPFRSSWMELVL
jgi:hypothetical protein